MSVSVTVRNILYGSNTKMRFCKGDISSNNTQRLPKATNLSFEEFLGAFLKKSRKTNISVITYVRPLFCIKQPHTHCTEFRQIL